MKFKENDILKIKGTDKIVLVVCVYSNGSYGVCCAGDNFISTLNERDLERMKD